MAGPPNDQYAILGNRLGFRLAYQSAELRARREAWTSFALDGAPVRVRCNSVTSVTIRDVINDTPNTCALAIDVRGGAAPPTVGQRLTVRINSNAPRTLFAGPLQTVGLTYELQPNQVVYPCQAIDDTPGANRKLPYGAWTTTSATTVAQWLVATFAPGYSAAAVQANLPAISVNFDATEGMDGCLRQIAKLIGGYFYWEDRVLHLFMDGEPGDTPDPIDASHPFLDSPPIAISTDTSQVRTRVYGKGYGEEVIADVAANDSIVPISNTVMFNPAGGQAVTETQRLRYTGTTPGGGGSLVGPGIGPSAFPTVTARDGAGVTAGYHYYAVTFQTAAGESLPSPAAGINVGARPAPTDGVTFPSPNAFVASGGVDPGTHGYAITDVTATGETLAGVAASVTVSALPSPPANFAPLLQGTTSLIISPRGAWVPGANVSFQFTHSNIASYPDFQNETVLSISSPSIVLPAYSGNPSLYYAVRVQVPYSNDPLVKYINIWGFVLSGPAGSDTVQRYVGQAQNFVNGGSGPIVECYNSANIPYPGANPYLKQVTVNVPATADPNVTNRNLYRTPTGTSQLKYRATYGPSGGTLTDTLADASLGVNVITTPTAVAAQILVGGLPIGASTVIGRKLYRTAAGVGQLRLLATVGDNATTSYLDVLGDASLGAPVPTTDTSGLKQPDGVVLAGSTSLVVAGAGWATPSGGWAIIGNGQQTIRYTSIVGNALSGIPATGPGAITATVAYSSTITAAAALLGVTGLLRALIKGAPINLWVQRDNTAAQAQLAAIDHTDGVIEHLITDERRGEASLILLCDADLEQYAYPIRTVPYATRDVKTKSGKPITINLASPAIALTLTIQDVTISEFNLSPGLAPRFTATASSVRFSLEDILRRLGASLDVTS